MGLCVFRTAVRTAAHPGGTEGTHAPSFLLPPEAVDGPLSPLLLPSGQVNVRLWDWRLWVDVLLSVMLFS